MTDTGRFTQRPVFIFSIDTLLIFLYAPPSKNKDDRMARSSNG